MIWKKILGSFICFYLAWLIPSIVWVIYATIWLGGYNQDWPLGIAVVAACFVMPVWLVIFMPLYALTPSRSLLWNWFVFAPVGAASGIVILILFMAGIGFGRMSYLLMLPSAFIGGLAGLFALLTKRWFICGDNAGTPEKFL